jgi:transcriptional regulator with XRE-family HTH domain
MLENLDTDEAILDQIGQRLARRRLDLGLTQAELAEKAGLGKRTVERIENGDSAQLSNLIRILRVLELLPRLDLLVPELGPRPMDLLRHKGKERRRASSGHDSKTKTQPWSWDDEK